jgi:hypothetical protein
LFFAVNVRTFNRTRWDRKGLASRWCISPSTFYEGRSKEEGRRKKEEGRRKREEGRKKEGG